MSLNLSYFTCTDVWPPGQICDSKAQLLNDEKSIEKSQLLTVLNEAGFTSLQSVSRKYGILLQVVQDADMAVLDKTTTDALSEVKNLIGCQFDILVQNQELPLHSASIKVVKRILSFR